MRRKKRCGSHPHWSSSSFCHYHFSDALCILQIYHHYCHSYCTFLIIILLLRHCHRHRFPSSPSLGFSFLLSPSPTQIPNHIPPPFRLSFLLPSMTTTKRAYKLRILPFSSLFTFIIYYYLMFQIWNLLFICVLRPSFVVVIWNLLWMWFWSIFPVLRQISLMITSSHSKFTNGLFNPWLVKKKLEKTRGIRSSFSECKLP